MQFFKDHTKSAKPCSRGSGREPIHNWALCGNSKLLVVFWYLQNSLWHFEESSRSMFKWFL